MSNTKKVSLPQVKMPQLTLGVIQLGSLPASSQLQLRIPLLCIQTAN
ncbi:TPA: hypothetical protein ACU9KK_000650 [Legionella anisa]|nr:hypothetical protein [Legionella anisa]MCW8425314.1 hypothetical protein [Legionella anisa]MCW8449257.1 hypothetical protein [Legionella anisa]UAK79724.1 hypothetical protein K8O89_01080 [Legionella anisa]